MAIYFYVPGDEHGYLSNFSSHGFAIDGVYWPTAEHFFQAQKAAGTDEEERIRRAYTPKDAKRLGRTVPLRSDWEEVKDEVMRRAVEAKFAAHEELAERLAATGEEELVEAAPGDFYWGAGGDGSGQNRLGQILMEVRASLQDSEQTL